MRDEMTKWTEELPLSGPDQVIGLWESLTANQKAAALRYDGPETFGPSRPINGADNEE